MAQRRTRSPARSRRPGRRATRGAASDRWLLLLLLTVLGIVVVSVVGERRFAGRERGGVVPLTMAEARISNAAVPIDARRRVRARPYRFQGGPAARAQAVDCLATAALYEAGDDLRGQRAVIQVILNRARAAGFPKTICGVVYQGHARTTGCQFSFTCDGSIQRRTIHAGWPAARRAARRGLAGHVFADVGGATHYHTDWMVPYWRDSLIKVAKVGSHLFYVRDRTWRGR